MGSQYYVTESDLTKLFNKTDLPEVFKYQFVRDYVALKNDLSGSGDEIDSLNSRMDAAEANISSLTITVNNLVIDVDTLQSDVIALDSSLNSHVANNSAHGVSGNNVGTNNFCTVATGGVVLLAATVANATSSAVSMVASPNAAGVAYVQADAATWVTMLNEHKAGINQLKTDLNSLITLFNSALSTEVTAKQRSP